MIRKAEIKDLGAIRKIYRETLHDWEFISEQQHIKNIKKGKIYVIDEDGVKGYATVSNNKILELAVGRKYQKQGLGKKLIDYLKEKYNYLSVLTNQAYDFYIKMGFRKIGVKISRKNKIPLSRLVWAKINLNYYYGIGGGLNENY